MDKRKDTTTLKGRLARALGSLNTAEFYRNLISVVIGILVTFGGSALIQRCSERREVAHILSIVRDELQMNLARIEEQKERLLYEYAAAAALKPYIDAPESIPADTIDKYFNTLINTFYLQIATNSFEVLKNSSQIHYIPNKELIRDLFEIYEFMESGAAQVRSEYSDKDKSSDSRDKAA